MAEGSSGSEEDTQEGDGCEAFICRHVAGYPIVYMFVYSNSNLGSLSSGMHYTKCFHLVLNEDREESLLLYDSLPLQRYILVISYPVVTV